MSDTTITTSEAPAVEQGKTVTATVLFRLSPVGQRAALIAGLPAARDQEITGEIPVELLSMCKITPDGKAIADLRERIGINEQGEVSRGSTWYGFYPDLDFPPDSATAVLVHVRDGLNAKCAEVVADTEKRQAEIQARRDAELADARARIDAAMDAMRRDPRHIPNSMPYPNGYKALPEHPVWAEIERREQSAKDAAERAAKAAEDEKRAFVRTFLAEHGTPDQVERFDAGLLPEKEYLDAMAEQVFAPFKDFPLYQKMMRAEVYEALSAEQGELVDAGDLKAQFRAADATEATAAEWQTLKQIQAAMPDAECKLRLHEASFDHEDIPWGVISRKGIQVKAKLGPFSFVREYQA